MPASTTPAPSEKAFANAGTEGGTCGIDTRVDAGPYPATAQVIDRVTGFDCGAAWQAARRLATGALGGCQPAAGFQPAPHERTYPRGHGTNARASPRLR